MNQSKIEPNWASGCDQHLPRLIFSNDDILF